jgi:hypothetical protein
LVAALLVLATWQAEAKLVLQQLSACLLSFLVMRRIKAAAKMTPAILLGFYGEATLVGHGLLASLRW